MNGLLTRLQAIYLTSYEAVFPDTEIKQKATTIRDYVDGKWVDRQVTSTQSNLTKFAGLFHSIENAGVDIWKVVFKSGVYAALVCLIYMGIRFITKSGTAQERVQEKHNVTEKIVVVFSFFILATVMTIIQLNGLDY
jgi:hypothetical protein